MAHSEQLHLVIQNFDKLPSLPGIAIKLIEALQQPEPDIQGISRLIAADAALSVNILKIINSSCYSLPVKITSIEQTINLLGLTAIENIALSLILRANFVPRNIGRLNLANFWKDALVGAIVARLLAGRGRLDNTGDIFFLSLLGNIGSLALAWLFPDQYSLVLNNMQQHEITAFEAESQVFGFSHADVGARLIEDWGFPATFHVPVQNHHRLENLPSDCDASICTRTQLLYFASLYIDLFNGHNVTRTFGYIRHFLETHPIVDVLDVAEIGQEVLEQTRELFPIFDIHFTNEGEVEALLENTRQELLNLSVRMANDIIGKNSQMESLRRQAQQDELTRLYNYKAFCERLRQELSRAARYQKPLTLILADIDYFKTVNDSYGHPAGDQVLRTVAGILQSSLRDSDLAARYGGEEFALILPETTLKAAFQVAERIRIRVRCTKTCYDGQAILVTMSFGLASFTPGNGMTFDDLIKTADEALYVSKKQGRNRCSSVQQAVQD